jgi:tetratricopeptide (TPR) repeat protein
MRVLPRPHELTETAMRQGRPWWRLLIVSSLLACGPIMTISTETKATGSSQTESFDSVAKRASAARDADQLDQAVALFKKALGMRPNWAEGWWSLGTLEYDRNNYKQAAVAFRRLLPLAPKDGTAYAMLGLCEYELGEDTAALKHIDQAMQLGISTNPQLREVVLYHHGLLLMRAGKYQAAQTPLGALCQNSVPSPDVVRALGLATFRIPPGEAPPDGSPGAEVVLRAGHAECISVQKKYDEAKQEYSALVAQYPDYPKIHYVYGKFLLEASDVPGAVTEFKQEIKNNPADINSRLEIAAAEYKINSAAGIPYAEEAVKLGPGLAFAHYLLGLLYLDVDEYLKAIPELEAAEKAFPKDAKVYFALGSAYSRAGRKPEAEKARAMFQKLSQGPEGDSKASY